MNPQEKQMRGRSVAVIATMLLAVACHAAPAKTGATAKPAADTSIEPNAKRFEEIDPKKFSNGATIDNEWWPLKPGSHFTYKGTTIDDEGDAVPHRLEIYVTDLVKKIHGIPVAVIYEKDYSSEKMVECELAFFAQDDEKNVWHLGQYSEVYDETELVGGRAFLVGHLEGAKAGIMVPGAPAAGSPSYSQGYGPPPYNWSDRGRVAQVGAQTKTALATYSDVLVIEEFSGEEPGAIQLKYFAKGTGNVRVGWKGSDKVKETMELAKVAMMGADELEKIRKEALALETRAYVYGSTEPAQMRANP
jgi:hypothetical protein